MAVFYHFLFYQLISSISQLGGTESDLLPAPPTTIWYIYIIVNAVFAICLTDIYQEEPTEFETYNPRQAKNWDDSKFFNL